MDSKDDATDSGNKPYALVPGLFGPGTVAAWYLTMLSIGLNWTLSPRYRLRLSPDFIAAVAYPVVASGYLMTQMTVLPAGDGAVDFVFRKLFSLRWKGLPSFWSIAGTVVEPEVPQDSSVLPWVLALHPAICIIEVFQWMTYVVFSLVAVYGHGRHRRRGAMRILFLGLAWSWIAIIVASIRTSYEFFLCLLPDSIGWFFVHGMSWHMMTTLGEYSLSSPFLHHVYLILAIMVWLITCSTVSWRVVFPTSGHLLSEVDQAFALGIGILMSVYNIYTLWTESEEE